MSKTCSFIKAGAILGGTVIVTAAVAPPCPCRTKISSH